MYNTVTNLVLFDIGVSSGFFLYEEVAFGQSLFLFTLNIALCLIIVNYIIHNLLFIIDNM